MARDKRTGGQEDRGDTDITDHLAVLLMATHGQRKLFRPHPSYLSQPPGPRTHDAAEGLQLCYNIVETVICG